MSANAIMGLLPSYLKPERGEILFQGRDLLKLDETTLLGMRGKDMAMVFQEPLSALNPVMTVGDQIAEVMRVHRAYPGEACQRRVLELLEFVGLPDPATLVHSYPFRLSGGQRQRVVIAMALALEPTLLIADEPTTALDVTTQAQILALIRRIQAEKGMGVMFVTHDFGVVAEIADRVAVMEKGVLVEIGTAAGAQSPAASLYPAADQRRATWPRARRRPCGRPHRARRAKPAQDLRFRWRAVLEEARDARRG
jgi:peptide/nickel transport system ATP-binding protein